ncbi:hypothetical protein G6F68_018990 [Rhizopus microsporus]|nr:hypothetical protein G6F68_018990 [Rhizopus microsporus]
MPPSLRTWARRPREQGHAGLPAGRECLRRPAAGTAEAAGRHPVQGDRRPHQAGRFQRAGARARLLVLQPLRDRPGLPDPRAPQGQHGGGRGSPAGRQRDGGRQGLLQRRFDGSEPGQPAAGLGRR